MTQESEAGLPRVVLTDYHAQYYAYELTRRRSSDESDKFSSTFYNATVDLNPHQIDAALFAFRNPLSRGAILADEVGLGKTIEAGLVISQLWAERKRRILCIVPASIRKQWLQELQEKFFVKATILETSNFNQAVRSGTANPFDAVALESAPMTPESRRQSSSLLTRAATPPEMRKTSPKARDARRQVLDTGPASVYAHGLSAEGRRIYLS